jgi:Antitoxin Xre/MbcA/ParS C-terminal toxin-binding domain
MAIPKRQPQRDPDEQAEIRDLITQVVAHPDLWLDTPNDVLGGKKPRDLIGTDQEERLRDLARAIKHGMPT